MARNHRIIAKAILSSKEQVLLIRRSDTDPRRPLQWDLPGGLVEEAEDFSETVSREIKEETGLEVPAAELELVYTKTEMRPEGNVIFLFFAGSAYKEQVKLSYEHDMHEWLPPQEALERIEYPIHRELFEYVIKHNLI